MAELLRDFVGWPRAFTNLLASALRQCLDEHIDNLVKRLSFVVEEEPGAAGCKINGLL